MKSMAVVLAALVTIASLLPFVRREAWWIRAADFPRVQIFFLSLATLALCLCCWSLATWEGIALVASVGSALLIQTICIFPYTPIAPHEVLPAPDPNPEESISLLVANVLMSNHRTEQLLRLIRDHTPDVVLLLEPDDWWEGKMRVLEEEGYEYTVKEPLANMYGMLLYSRLPLLDPQIKYLLRDGIPSMHQRVQLRSGKWIWLHGVHPEPPSPTEADSSLPRDAELLIVGREVKDHNIPTIVAGDLNDVAWSYTTRLFQKISTLLDPRKGRGMFNTFHAKIPCMRWPLDHIFHSEHFLLDEMKRLPAFGSDHFPVFIRLVLQPGAEELQEPPAADHEDAAVAQEKISKAVQQEK